MIHYPIYDIQGDHGLLDIFEPRIASGSRSIVVCTEADKLVSFKVRLNQFLLPEFDDGEEFKFDHPNTTKIEAGINW